jgi:hypothetical protein
MTRGPGGEHSGAQSVMQWASPVLGTKSSSMRAQRLELIAVPRAEKTRWWDGRQQKRPQRREWWLTSEWQPAVALLWVGMVALCSS